MSVQNLNGAASSGFTTFAPFPYETRNYMPRTYAVRYQFRIGNSEADHSPLLATSQIAPSGSLFFIPIAFENEAHKDWLAVDTASPICGPEMRDPAMKLLDDIRNFDRKTGEAFRNNRPLPKSTMVDGMALTAFRAPTNYAIRIQLPNDARVLGPLWKCARLHEGNIDEARVLGLYTPGWKKRYADGVGTIYFAPQAGLYFSPDPVNETSPQSPPAGNFPDPRNLQKMAVISKQCPSTYRNAVAPLLSQIGSYIRDFYAGKRPLPPEQVEFSPHPSKQGTWLEILPKSDSLGNAIILCGSIPTISEATQKRFQLDAAPQPSINFMPTVGFYVLSQ